MLLDSSTSKLIASLLLFTKTKYVGFDAGLSIFFPFSRAGLTCWKIPLLFSSNFSYFIFTHFAFDFVRIYLTPLLRLQMAERVICVIMYVVVFA